MRSVFLAAACLCVVGCGFYRNQPTPDEAVGHQSAGTEDAPGDSPAATGDPASENPVRDLTEDLEAQQPFASDPEPDAAREHRPDPLIEGLFSAWTDRQLIDLLFPDNRFLQGPEFLDGGPNTLYRLCVQDGTPEYICRQRYAP